MVAKLLRRAPDNHVLDTWDTSNRLGEELDVLRSRTDSAKEDCSVVFDPYFHSLKSRIVSLESVDLGQQRSGQLSFDFGDEML